MLRCGQRIFQSFVKTPLKAKSNVHQNLFSKLSTYKNIYRFSSESNEKKEGDEYVSLTFINKDKSEKVVQAKVGESLLEVAHQNDIDLEGACDSSLACSTCHVILDYETYDSLPMPKPEEEDMLDLAFGLTETSRLGCQVIVKKEFEGVKVTLPRATRNMYVDGHKPKHH